MSRLCDCECQNAGEPKQWCRCGEPYDQRAADKFNEIRAKYKDQPHSRKLANAIAREFYEACERGEA